MRTKADKAESRTAASHYPQQGVTAMSSSIKIRRAVALAILTGTLGYGAAANAEPPLAYKIFDAPGAGTTPGLFQGTLGFDINDFGVSVGLVRDENSVRHGYLRFPDGKFLVFDHPSAGTNGANGEGTRVGGLNELGAVAGSVRDSLDHDLPYVRDPDGNFHTITFNTPDFGGGNGDAINLCGVMVGNFLKLSDPNSPDFLHYHGFLLHPDGAMTVFDPPGSTMTEIPPSRAINDFGAVTGDYWVCSADLSSCAVHGFIRSANGKYVSFDAPGANPDPNFGGTYPQAINALGEVTGYYGDSNSVFHGFVRHADGRMTSFDFPTTCTNTTTPPQDCAYEGTFPAAVNVLGQVVGAYYGEDGNSHGFLREADGTIRTVDFPNANDVTQIQTINDFGQMTGIVTDSNAVEHGVIVKP
jgi:hypothetical protein